MANDAKAEEILDQVRDAFALSIRQALAEVPAHRALQVADHLCRVQCAVLAGLRVSYRKSAEVDGAAIADSWARGLSLGEVTERHGCSRATAYRFHPNKSARHARGS